MSKNNKKVYETNTVVLCEEVREEMIKVIMRLRAIIFYY